MSQFDADFSGPEFENIVLQLQNTSEFSLSDCLRQLFIDLHAEGKLGSLLSEFKLNTDYELTRGIWRPTSLHRCMQRHIYKVVGVPKQTVPHQPEQQLDFNRGHVFEAWVMAYISKLVGRYGFTRIDTNVEIYDPTTELGGRADFILWRGDVPYLGEIKSKDEPFAFSRLKQPQQWHRMQINDYMGATINSRELPFIGQGWVVYIGPQFRGEELCHVCKGGHKIGTNIRDFFVRFNEGMWESTKQEIKLMELHLDRLDLMASKTTNPGMMCPGCPYLPPCSGNIPPDHAVNMVYPKGMFSAP